MTDLFTDPEHDRVVALSNSGVDYLTACRMQWAPHLLPGRVSVSDRLRARLHAEAGAVSDGGVLWVGCLFAASLFIVVLAVGAR